METEQRFNKVEKRIKTVEEAILLLSELSIGHGERLDDSLRDRENLNEKISALIDAQIRSEDRTQEANTKISALIDAQIRTEDRMQETNAKLAFLADLQIENVNSIKEINQALDKLIELVNNSRQRLDRLES